MHHARAVHLVERYRHVPEASDRFRGGERASPRKALREVLPLEQLHHQKRRVVTLFDTRVEHVHDMRAADLRGQARLLQETRAKLGLIQGMPEHDLDRAAATRDEVFRFVDRPHASGRNRAQDAISLREDKTFVERQLHVKGRGKRVSPSAFGARIRRSAAFRAHSAIGERRGTLPRRDIPASIEAPCRGLRSDLLPPSAPSDHPRTRR
jgi:hypothetical protein